MDLLFYPRSQRTCRQWGKHCPTFVLNDFVPTFHGGVIPAAPSYLTPLTQLWRLTSFRKSAMPVQRCGTSMPTVIPAVGVMERNRHLLTSDACNASSGGSGHVARELRWAGAMPFLARGAGYSSRSLRRVPRSPAIPSQAVRGRLRLRSEKRGKAEMRQR